MKKHFMLLIFLQLEIASQTQTANGPWETEPKCDLGRLSH